MFLKELHTFQYRNIELLNLECNPNINCIIGKNGIGKTNLLDSIYYLAFCKSNLPVQDSLNVKQGTDSFMIKGLFENNANTFSVQSAYTLKDKEKVIRCNDKKYQRFSDHIGQIPLIFISPADVSIINGGGSERRKFLDSYICMCNKEYLDSLVLYNKLITQRNAYLKQGKSLDYSYIDVLDMHIAKYAQTIYEFRKEELEVLSSLTQQYYTAISDAEVCSISYSSDLDKHEFKKQLEDSFERDLILGYTTLGVHKDEIQFNFNDSVLRYVGSQGQKKSFLLALKFSEYQLIKQKKGEMPILLLDDLFDKLDAERTEKVFDIIDKEEFGQIFITDTDKILLEKFLEHKQYNGTFWKLENGQIKKQ